MNIKTIHTKNLRWLDVVNPKTAELDYLKRNFNFHPLDMEDVAGISQHPKIEDREDYQFIVLLFPVFRRETRTIHPGEVNFFVGKNYVITIHDGAMHTMSYMLENVNKDEVLRKQYMGRNSGYLLYQIFEALFRRSYPMLNHISREMNEIEENIFNNLTLQMLKDISLMKRNVIDFRRIMKTHHLIIKQLQGKKIAYLTFPESKSYYGNIIEHSENIWDILATQKETIEALQDTNQSLATNRLNKITTTMALFSSIFLPATLVMFIFGLSIKHIPFANHPYGFWLILGLAALSSIIMVSIFRSKKWFN